MEEPEWIPCRVSFPMATWHKHRDKLEEIVLRHPRIFPDHERSRVDFDNFGLQRKDRRVSDEWGCIWNFLVDGLDGQVIEHPLEDWRSFDSFKPPDPEASKEGLYCSYPSNWNQVRDYVVEAKKRGRMAFGSVPHGFMFMRLHYLRGFSNLMMDFACEHPRLQDLIDMVLEYNLKMIRKWLETGVDIMGFADDLGMQDRLPVSPKVFRRYLIPSYREIFKLAHEYGAYAYLHTDGHILEVAEDLIEAGVDIINPQVRPNRIEGIGGSFKGKVLIDLDVDRQYVLPFGTRQDVRDHIRDIVIKLGSKQGGLWVLAGCYPDVPLTNIDALCKAMEDYQYYFSKCGSY